MLNMLVRLFICSDAETSLPFRCSGYKIMLFRLCGLERGYIELLNAILLSTLIFSYMGIQHA